MPMSNNGKQRLAYIYDVHIYVSKSRNILHIIIQHIDTLPKYGKKTLDVRRST